MKFLSFLGCGQLILLVSASDVKVKPGDDAVLPCYTPVGAAITVLEWTKLELQSKDYVFFYRNRRPYENYQDRLFKGRVELKDVSSVTDGDVSVVLKNVTREDIGTYKCRVLMSTRDGAHSETTNLIIETDSGNANEPKAARVSKEEPMNGGFGAKDSLLIGVVAAAVVVVAAIAVVVIVLKRHGNRLKLCYNQFNKMDDKHWENPPENSESTQQETAKCMI
ncbi:uncharacterized protein LOC108246277 [Kryptolebias marmoratus]|uniref:uncharacterized protein LOC108246277 n=1 Tax=Kryptolebias marmoratus TaxID=37003 RepID=UPI0007F89B8C|nr:uncharacterized protein LOC108246277 [Kryptolebias marmoratus]